MQIREKKGFSREEVAAEFGVSFSTIRNWEKGRTKIPALQLAMLAEKYDMDLNEIYKVVHGKDYD